MSTSAMEANNINNMPASNVTGKRILITGGASGIGAASALLLASRGAKVVIGDMNEALGASVAKQGEDAGHSIIFKKVTILHS